MAPDAGNVADVVQTVNFFESKEFLEGAGGGEVDTELECCVAVAEGGGKG